MSRTYQEKAASAISKRLNKKVAWCYNNDRSIDVYMPKLGIVVTINKYIEINVRPGYGRNPSQLELDMVLARANDAARKVIR